MAAFVSVWQLCLLPRSLPSLPLLSSLCLENGASLYLSCISRQLHAQVICWRETWLSNAQGSAALRSWHTLPELT